MQMIPLQPKEKQFRFSSFFFLLHLPLSQTNTKAIQQRCSATAAARFA
jgi:hypothetical protein